MHNHPVRRIPSAAIAATLLIALSCTATLALAATAEPATRRPQSLFPPDAARDATRPPLLPPVHGIDVPNRVEPAAARVRHADPESARGLDYERPKPKAPHPVGRRGVGYPLDEPVATSESPWAPKFVGGLQQSFDAIDFDDNGTVTNGNRFIPPDSNAAVSPTHVVAVANVAMRIFDRNGTSLVATRSLKDFFATLSPQTFLFDPKVMWDEHAQRFVLVALEQTEAPDPETSFIMLAVSSGPDPTGSWFRTKIDAKRTLNGTSCWGDYPGFGFDEQALYVGLNMFAFSSGQSCNASLLWIVEKGTSGGFYNGGTAVVRQINPFATGGALPLTIQVARMRGTQPSGGVGTFLVGFDGLSNGTNEFLQVARVDNPTTSTPDVTVQDYAMGNIAVSGALPQATQPAGFQALDPGDKRALDAAWRANRLYATFTTSPPSGTNAGEATAHWVEVDTTRIADGGSPPVVQQGDIGGEELGANVHTFYPSIDVNALGAVVVGFSASGAGATCQSGLCAGAYAVGRRSSDAAGTMSAPVTIHAGLDPYLRTFGTDNPNRWGDYSSVSMDPGVVSPGCFWVFNQWADTRGSAVGNEDGRWGTTVGRVCTCDGTESTGDTDLDGICNDRETDLSITKTDNRTTVNAGSALTYGIVVTNVGGSTVNGATVNDTFPAALSGCSWTCTATTGGGCAAGPQNGNISNQTINVAQGGSVTYTATCTVPAGTGPVTLSNTATVSHPNDVNTSNNSASDTTTVVPRADLRITKTDGATAINAGSQVTWTIVASNLDGFASGGTVNDTFNAPLQSCTWTCNAGPGSVCPSSGSGNLSASVSLAATGSVTFTARCTVSPGASGTLSNTATIAGINDPNAANNSATDADTAIRAQADVSITKSDGMTVVNAGANVAYSIVVRNNGSANIAGVTVNDAFPAPLTGCAWTCVASGASTCTPGSGATLADTIAIAAGATVTYTATCAVPAGASGTLVNTASVAYVNDPQAGNNVATDGDTAVRPRADVSIDKTDNATSVDAGASVTYAIVVTNGAATPIADVAVADAFPAPLANCRWTCAASGAGSCALASGTGPIATTVALAANGTATFAATCRVPIDATGTLSNTATAAYANDPTPANDSDGDTDTQIVPPVFANSFE